MSIDSHFTYLTVLVCSIVFPLALSFDRKVNFKQHWSVLIFSVSIIAFLFIMGDIIYTYLGVWGFNEKLHLSYNFFGLPLEEMAFFFVVPYACLFIYEVLKGYITLKPWRHLSKVLLGLAVLTAIISLIFSKKLYTTASFSFTAFLLLYLYRMKTIEVQYILLAYLVSLLPFLLVNGFLTGMFTQDMVVWYNQEENIAIRIGSIPIEDFSYSFNLLTLNILSLNYFKKKRVARIQQRGTI